MKFSESQRAVLLAATALCVGAVVATVKALTVPARSGPSAVAEVEAAQLKRLRKLAAESELSTSWFSRMPETRTKKEDWLTAKALLDAHDRLLAHKRQHGSFPEPVAFEATAGWESSMTKRAPAFTLPGLGTDPYLFGTELKIRYGTDGTGAILVAAGPDYDWDFDTTHYRSGMTIRSPELAPHAYDNSKGLYANGDVILTIAN